MQIPFQLNQTIFRKVYACNEYSMSIPLHNRMVKEDYEYIVAALKVIK